VPICLPHIPSAKNVSPRSAASWTCRAASEAARSSLAIQVMAIKTSSNIWISFQWLCLIHWIERVKATFQLVADWTACPSEPESHRLSEGSGTSYFLAALANESVFCRASRERLSTSHQEKMSCFSSRTTTITFLNSAACNPKWKVKIGHPKNPKNCWENNVISKSFPFEPKCCLLLNSPGAAATQVLPSSGWTP